MTEVRLTIAEAAVVRAVVARVQGLALLAPELVMSELGPALDRLEARRFACDQCGRPCVRKRMHRRKHAFCGRGCRNNARRKGAVNALTPLTAQGQRP